MVSQRASRSPEQAELRAMFAAIDKDKNGYIDPGVSLSIPSKHKELNHLMLCWAWSITDAGSMSITQSVNVLCLLNI